MFHFAWPWAAALLPLPLVVAWLRSAFLSRRRVREDVSRPALLHPQVEWIAEAFRGAHPPDEEGRVRLGWWLLAIWVLCVLAFMRPQWMEAHSEARTLGHDLMLALDTSRSMEALDFSRNGREITRMAVVKGVASEFIAGRQGDRVGLIVFGDRAYQLVPFTQDLEAVRFLLEGVEASMVGDATAMGDAIGLAVRKLKERPPGARVLVLVSDGESTAGRLPPLLAAQLAARAGIRIYTIGVGRKGLVPIVEDGRRKMEKMEVDEQTLRGIALLTGGAYFPATDTAALESIYARIDALERTEVRTGTIWVPRPLYRWPLLGAMGLFLVLGFFPGLARRYRTNQAVASGLTGAASTR